MTEVKENKDSRELKNSWEGRKGNQQQNRFSKHQLKTFKELNAFCVRNRTSNFWEEHNGKVHLNTEAIQ